VVSAGLQNERSQDSGNCMESTFRDQGLAWRDGAGFALQAKSASSTTR
jgi:hypothetical protein